MCSSFINTPSYFNSLIATVSGWRKIFTPVGRDYKSKLRTLTEREDGNISDEDFLLIFYAVTSYLDIMLDQWVDVKPPYTIAFGQDTRVTGTSMIEAALHAARLHGQASRVRVLYMGVMSAPQIMSYTRMYADGFVYITASHNPPEYNGIKFGAGDGGVLKRARAQKVIDWFFSTYAQKIPSILEGVSNTHYDTSSITTLLTQNEQENIRAYEAYSQTVLQAVFRGLQISQEYDIESMTSAVHAKVNAQCPTLGIVWDTNGGARSTAFDETFLCSLGIATQRLHTEFGVFAHQIIPEGQALEDARCALIALNNPSPESADAKSAYPFAVVSDCDGDRGNIIFYDETLPERVHVMKAQEVFVFVLSIELMWQHFVNPNVKLALVVNGPSTMRCEIIASRYNCEVFRVETGEANLVTMAQQLRSKGYSVPIVGEASNGGIIMYPSTVRDPLCTALSCMKLLLWQEEFAAHVSQHEYEVPHLYDGVFARQMQTLPVAATTEVEDTLAKCEIPQEVCVAVALQHVAVYGAYNIQRLVDLFEHAGISIVRVMCCNFVGTTIHKYDIKEVESQRIKTGGLGFYFYGGAHGDEVPCGFVWMRPSGTEPFVRLVADVIGKSSAELERILIEKWRSMVHEAVLSIAFS